jgi:hypothetical protein
MSKTRGSAQPEREVSLQQNKVSDLYQSQVILWFSVISWASLMQNEPRLDAGADQTRLVRTLGV